jgi:Tfp pilus assembly protein PilF
MPPDPVCPRCGEPVPSGEPDCPYCAGRKKVPLLHREPLVIAGVVLVAAALWVGTTFVTAAYAARQQRLARLWFARGEADVRAGRLDNATTELRTALAYSPDNFEYRLRLAEALASEGHTRQAQAYLRALWDEEPGNGTVNLELARLAARTHDLAGVLRFYHGAIYGVWQDNPARRRREARLELVNFLLAQRQIQQAQSELIGLAADLPRDPALLLGVAGLMMKAGEFRRALEEYREVLALDPHDVEALAGAGSAAFALHMYPEARDSLRRAVAAGSPGPQVAAQLQTAELVLQMDPYQPRLPASERIRRILSAFTLAGNRLQQCASARAIALDKPGRNKPLPADYKDWMALKPNIKERRLRRDLVLGDAAMDMVFRIQRNTAQVCGPGAPADQALVLIARQHNGSTP